MTKTDSLILRSRIAKQTDYKAITRLCIRSVPPRGGYVLPILRDVIEAGGLFLAWKENELVGMTNFDRCLDGTGWLSMARTDPKWRGRGVAGFLQSEIGAYSRRKGTRTLRLLVASKNKPSIRACVKGEFEPICEVAHLSRKLRSKKRTGNANSETHSKISLRTVLKSSHLTKMKGYVPYGWQVVRMSDAVIRRLRRRGELHSLDGCWFILTRPEKDNREVESTFSFLDGSVSKSFGAVLGCVGLQGVSYLSGYVPYGRHELRVARRLGFKASRWGRHCIVFEKKLP